jgi:hypothetical protein
LALAWQSVFVFADCQVLLEAGVDIQKLIAMGNTGESGASEWDLFLVSTAYPWCWWCGRGFEHAHEFEEQMIVERAHVVSKRRLKDRRVAVLLCSHCHRMEHTGSWPVSGGDAVAQITLPCKLWLKRAFDPDWYDEELLASASVQRLPEPEAPPESVQWEYLSRRLAYPK